MTAAQLACLVSPGGGQISGYLAAVADGLKRHGIAVGSQGDLVRQKLRGEATFAICWGWRRGAALRQRGFNVLVVERGYIGDRREWTSLAWNGLNGRGDFCLEDGVPEFDPARRSLISGLTRPWRKKRKQKGDIILVMGQVQGDMSLRGRDLVPWYRDMAKRAVALHGLPVLFRPHPVAVQKRRHQFVGIAESKGSLAEDLARAWGVISFNSNSAVDAVLAGVPALTADDGAMAWAVTAHDLKDLGQRPARAAWARRVSWCQWQMPELATGQWWERMRAGLNRQPHPDMVPGGLDAGAMTIGENVQPQSGGQDGTDSRHAALG